MGSWVDCDTVACPDPHDVNNLYALSTTTVFVPDGNAFTDYLGRLNADPTVVAATTGEAKGDPALDPTVCFAHYCDWRLPAIGGTAYDHDRPPNLRQDRRQPAPSDRASTRLSPL